VGCPSRSVAENFKRQDHLTVRAHGRENRTRAHAQHARNPTYENTAGMARPLHIRSRMNRLTHLLATLTLTLATACIGNTASNEQPSSGHDDHDHPGAGPASRGDCTLTQGFWKNHEEAWPVTTLSLGSVSYSTAQLLDVLRTPVRGNGLVSLAHQLIAAKLNVAAGADATTINASISDADAMIGALVSPSVGSDRLDTTDTSSLVGALDDFNNGNTGPGHCDDNPPPPPPPEEPCSCCGDGVVEGSEQCDDGNTTSGDGCSATCTTEAPYCGDGTVDAGEQCDDGNTTGGDGCSATCTTEVPPPEEPCSCCGDGIVEGSEQCDDGNSVDTDSCTNSCLRSATP
jgi:cysteine-rich repeat protein